MLSDDIGSGTDLDLTTGGFGHVGFALDRSLNTVVEVTVAATDVRDFLYAN